MWTKYKKNFFLIALMPVLMIPIMLFVVSLFEVFNIHVTGGREMWVSFIGAVLGGSFTLFGVLITIYNQEKSNLDAKRLENMPILGFEKSYSNDEAELILTVLDDELVTSAFKVYEKKEYIVIKVYSTNKLPAFDYTVEGCVIDGKVISLGDCFNPSKKRLIDREYDTLIFDYDNLYKNIFCLLRFSYRDIFGNKYYQDLPFMYLETTKHEGYKGLTRQIIDIRDIKQPILVSKKAKQLHEVMKEYNDYRA